MHDVGAEAISFRSNCTVVGIKQQPDDLCKSVNMNALICQHMLCSHHMTLVLSVFSDITLQFELRHGKMRSALAVTQP